MADLQEFKFPDEQSAEKPEADKEFDIEIVDDMPPQDRLNAEPMPKEIVEKLEKDELEDYDDKVKDRFKQLKKVWHDERRAKEAAAREREEALKFAQTQMEENRLLKQRLGRGEQAYVQEVTKAATNDLATAKEKLKLAYESGDTDKIIEAQELLTDAKQKLRDYERFRPSLQKEEDGVESKPQVTTPQASANPVLDPKAEAWKQRNTWFGVDEEMTALALGLHEKLVRSGVDPRSDDYYRTVDETMRKRYPENFSDETPPKEPANKEPVRKASTVVAPATRSTSPRQIRLTSSQVALAKKLGLSNEQYARELMKLENGNG